MDKVEVVRPERYPARSGHGPPHCQGTGEISSRRASPPEAPIWMWRAELGEGAVLDWSARHGDEALYLVGGELEVDGRICPEGGAIVVEANSSPRVRARAASQVVHMGPSDPEPPVDGLYGPAQRARPQVHVVGPRGTFETLEQGRETRFFADATCSGCRLWLLYTARDFAWETQTHSHSQDELIHLLAGEIHLGSNRLGPGASLFIAAHQPYRFRAGEKGFAFINYRRDASRMTVRSTGEEILEAGAATGLTAVDDLR